jgi:hypothetical protein
MGDTVIVEEDDKPKRPDVIVAAPEKKKPKTERVTVEKTTVTETRHSDDD